MAYSEYPKAGSDFSLEITKPGRSENWRVVLIWRAYFDLHFGLHTYVTNQHVHTDKMCSIVCYYNNGNTCNKSYFISVYLLVCYVSVNILSAHTWNVYFH